jgi:hypothetical protein
MLDRRRIHITTMAMAMAVAPILAGFSRVNATDNAQRSELPGDLRRLTEPGGGEAAAAAPSNYSRGEVRNRLAPPTKKTGTRFSRRRTRRRKSNNWWTGQEKRSGINPGLRNLG